MNILITGDRNFNNWNTINSSFDKLTDLYPTKYNISEVDKKNINVIHGDCRGADKMCGYVAKKLGYNIVCKPADWKKYGKAAGPIRNKEMIDLITHDYKENKIKFIILIFHENIEESRGTKNCIQGVIKNLIKINVDDYSILFNSEIIDLDTLNKLIKK
jgi:hypothetical protein